MFCLKGNKIKGLINAARLIHHFFQKYFVGINQISIFANRFGNALVA